ncbi:DUF7683 domain-containing protein [Dyadobacter tibetensis]|uniref:DUF7683 domain-containing protein n=1 Tax=Dyadobacter tibetensis TaxID=1211851 RepID=UPI0004701067|nr:hypothetical protein [Dyadobacter tibetensis]
MKIERVITSYNNMDDSFHEDFNVDDIPFEEIISIFSPKEDDPLMYDPYEINLEQSNLINKYIPSFAFDFGNYSYFLESYSVKE